ncbi:type I-E CRISPR-associated protein Cas6/Cse3/CasE, partial [Streptomyces durbertensis]
RLDHNGRADVHLYLVSPDRPDLTHLVEQAGWPALATDAATPGWQTRPYGPLLDRLAEGDTWAFRLTANPVHHIRRKPGEPTKRTAHLTARHQLGWLLDEERQKRCGFQVLEKPAARRLLPAGTTHKGHPHHGDRYELTVTDERSLNFRKGASTGTSAGAGASGGGPDGSNPRRQPVRLVTVTYDGRLKVTDPDALRRTLTQGLGKARAYGCGLMTLAPLPPATPP